MFRLRDRRGTELVLGMTHEEIFAYLALELASYRELPQFWYQFQTKFRDEPRPKSGLLRVREFTMKDSYSFDIDEAGLDVSFEAHRGAYERIFERLGIPAIGVEASSGNMGGSDSVGVGDIRPAQADEIREALGASPGSLGAVAITGLPIIADLALQGRRNMTTGATVDDMHLTGVDVERDIPVGRWADLREVRAGEPCPHCGGPLEIIRAIEVGHIFKLGRKYTTVLGVSVLGPDGASIIPIMGSYGIGVERAMAVIAEGHHDDVGLTWPVQVAPAGGTAVLLSPQDAATAAAAPAPCAQLHATGGDVVLDDRDERPGVKYRDAELVGIPCRVSVGRRDLAEGMVEITSRATGEKERVPVEQAVKYVQEFLSAQRVAAAAAAAP